MNFMDKMKKTLNFFMKIYEKTKSLYTTSI